MKTLIACVLVACVVVVLLIVIFSVPDIIEFAIASHDTNKQMNAAKKYMDSLTDKDVQAWIQRTQKYLNEYKYDPTNGGFNSFDAPPELQQLGIEGIEEQSNEVDYVWLGGMDDTALSVERMSNGDFQVVAVYTPYSNSVIWPKQ